MLSPSPAQFNSDAETTGALNLDSIVPYSPSDHTDLISDPVQHERELAHEILHKESAASEQATDGLRGATISYEEALERELEYQKRMKMILSQPPVGSTLLPTPSQGLLPKASLVGVKRKAVCGELAEPSSRGSHDPNLPRDQLQDWQAAPQLQRFQQPSPQLLQDRRPSVQQSQHQKPLPQGLTNRQPLAQGLRHRQTLTQKSQDQPPRQPQSKGQQCLPQQSHNQQPPNFQETPLWCNLCKVKCVTPHNLKCHFEGKKHKAKWNEVFGSKTGTVSNGAGSAGFAVQAASSRHEREALASHGLKDLGPSRMNWGTSNGGPR